MNNDLEQFFINIENKQKEINNNPIWYRGHSDTNYKLIPTILRNGYNSYERSLFYDYKTHASFLNKVSKSNWDTLLDMQHYGLPTRLLDWTTSLGTALFFAIKDNPKSPCIWLLSPHDLNYISTKDTMIYDISVVADNAQNNDDLRLFSLFTKQSRIEKPFSIQPPHSNPRIAAQRGMFTVQGSLESPLEELCPNVLKKIEIPVSIISSLKKHLTNLGIDDFSVFPDHYGLKNYLINQIKSDNK